MLGDLEEVLRKQGFALDWILSGSRVILGLNILNNLS